MPDLGPRSHFHLFAQRMARIGDRTAGGIGDVLLGSGSVAYSRFLVEGI